MTKLPTVTVAISAYNEEGNIANFLEYVLMQKEEGFAVTAIKVYSDGSTDNTAKIVKKYKDKRIRLIKSKKRIGKSSRLNDIYKNLKTEYLVQSDADVVFSHPHVVRDIITPLTKSKTVGMCGGNPLPQEGVTFTEKAVNCTVLPYVKFRSIVRGGNNVFSADGRLLAFKKEVVKKIVVPSDMIANDAYTFFCTQMLGYKYKFVESAIVNYRSPTTLKDQIIQNTRFRSAPIRMSKYFPKNILDREYKIAKVTLYKELFIQFIKTPVKCSYVFAVNRYCNLKAHKVESSLNAKWAIAHSTKDFS